MENRREGGQDGSHAIAVEIDFRPRVVMAIRLNEALGVGYIDRRTGEVTSRLDAICTLVTIDPRTVTSRLIKPGGSFPFPLWR